MRLHLAAMEVPAARALVPLVPVLLLLQTEVMVVMVVQLRTEAMALLVVQLRTVREAE